MVPQLHPQGLVLLPLQPPLVPLPSSLQPEAPQLPPLPHILGRLRVLLLSQPLLPWSQIGLQQQAQLQQPLAWFLQLQLLPQQALLQPLLLWVLQLQLVQEQLVSRLSLPLVPQLGWFCILGWSLQLVLEQIQPARPRFHIVKIKEM
ncbi:hypothetical protein Leryth_019655 [Lithospermum erythrorhizon]|nr:hypothetical protein Leryth_019655 [Lithospermum erythrorhizon]